MVLCIQKVGDINTAKLWDYVMVVMSLMLEKKGMHTCRYIHIGRSVWELPRTSPQLCFGVFYLVVFVVRKPNPAVSSSINAAKASAL